MGNNNYDYDPKEWKAAKELARQILIQKAKEERIIFYSQLAEQIPKPQFDPHSYAFAEFLGQISKEENTEGRGMLTVLVVDKANQRPGDGFFTLAHTLGRKYKDEIEFQALETKIVFDAWK